MTIVNGSLNKINNSNGRQNMANEKEKVTMRTPFPAHQISKLPKPTKAQIEEVRANFKVGIRCTICGGWHHPNVVHLDYVGHAALTDRLLDVDANWTWEPVAMDSAGLPAIDKDGGLWIRLTVLGVTRLGYGDAQGKTGGDAMKERIGDALRNAAMRFGAALDLWHKGDLHIEDDAVKEPSGKITPTSGAWELMEQDQQTFLMDIAKKTIELINASDVKGAVLYIEDQRLQPEEMVALWTRFDSKQRSAMKRAKEEMKR